MDGDRERSESKQRPKTVWEIALLTECGKYTNLMPSLLSTKLINV